MNTAYEASFLPLDNLIDANTKLEVYKEKIKDSKLDSSWFMPTLQQKEALAASQLEGTQATLDGVLVNQVAPNDNDKKLNEVGNYYLATGKGAAHIEPPFRSLKLASLRDKKQVDGVSFPEKLCAAELFKDVLRRNGGIYEC